MKFFMRFFGLSGVCSEMPEKMRLSHVLSKIVQHDTPRAFHENKKVLQFNITKVFRFNPSGFKFGRLHL